MTRVKSASRTLFAVSVVIVSILLIAGCQAGEAGVRESATDFEMRLYDIESGDHSETLRLSDLEGNIVVLNFWAEWCAPCKAEMPALDAVHHEFRQRGMQVTVLGVDMGIAQNPPGQPTVDFLEALDISFPVGTPLDISLGSKYRVTGLPVSILVDSTGKIAKRWSGVVTESDLESAIETELERQGAANG
jgi:thiol-disulfide isomerase/thioredoxin